MLRAREIWITPEGGTSPLLRGLSLTLERGEWIAIGGPNGSGKSTLAMALAGLRPVERGSIELDGLPFGPGSPRQAVAVLMQDPASQLLQPTIEGELAFAARNLDRSE